MELTIVTCVCSIKDFNYYNNSLKRVSINKDDEFMSLTLSTFKLFLTLTRTDSDVNRIKATQNGVTILIKT